MYAKVVRDVQKGSIKTRDNKSNEISSKHVGVEINVTFEHKSWLRENYSGEN